MVKNETNMLQDIKKNTIFAAGLEGTASPLYKTRIL